MALLFKKGNAQEETTGTHPDAESQEWDFLTGDDDSSGASEKLDFSVTAICGASSDKFQLAGQSVGSARKFLASILNIDPGAAALVNGKEVKDNYTLRRNDHLEFVKKAGEKGTGESNARA